MKAVKVMHTVALRTEATITGGETPPNLGQVFKVSLKLSSTYLRMVVIFLYLTVAFYLSFKDVNGANTDIFSSVLSRST